MTTLSRSDQALRQAFKQGNRLMLLLWRLGLGNFGNSPATSQVMVLVHTGRKTGKQRYTPVNYALIDGDVYCTAAFGPAADWYQNLVANPSVEVWLRDGRWAGVAEEIAADDPTRLYVMRQVLIASGFAAPLLAGIQPKTMSDEDLAQVTAPYRLFHIRRIEARTGPGGPGDLAWVWPVLGVGLLGVLLARTFGRRPGNKLPAVEDANCGL